MKKQAEIDNVDYDLEEESDLPHEPAALPFQLLLKAKRKRSQETLTDAAQSQVSQGHSRHHGERRAAKVARLNKHAPMEVSTKQSVSRARMVVEVDAKQETTNDPRFNLLCGKFEEGQFRKSYGFLSQRKSEEISDLKKRLKGDKREKLDEEARQRLSLKVSRLQSELDREAKKEHAASVVQSWRKDEKQRQRNEGKQPYYLNKKSLKEMVAKDRLDSMDKRQLFKVQQKKQKRERKKESKGKVPWKDTVDWKQ